MLRQKFLQSRGVLKSLFLSLPDYNFLEEALNEVEVSKKLKQTVGIQKFNRYLPPALNALQRQAKSRGVDLLFLPFGMSRRKENSSYFDKK